MTTLNLRRLGGFSGVPHEAASRMLTPVAVAGLLVAAASGVVLFSARAGEYAALGVFRAKLALVALGAASAVALIVWYGLHMVRASSARRGFHAALSLATWLGALALGRLIAFVG